MAKAKRVVPKFQTEAEEAQWWYDHREKHADDFVAAVDDGQARRPTKALLLQRSEISNPVSIRFTPEDMQLARELAERKGLPYQTYIKSLLHEALAREKSKVRR